VSLKAVHASLKRDQVIQALRAAIVSGELPPGERIVEVSLARELGVSQTPVREALAVLGREGLVTKLDHRGTFVAQIDWIQLRELMTVRAVLEGYCARLVCERADVGVRAALEACIEAMRAAADNGDLAALTRADMAFHKKLYARSGHRLLAEILLGIGDRALLALTIADAAYSVDLHDVAESHVPIVEAIVSGEPGEADRLAHEHVLASISDSPDPLDRSRSAGSNESGEGL